MYYYFFIIIVRFFNRQSLILLYSMFLSLSNETIFWIFFAMLYTPDPDLIAYFLRVDLISGHEDSYASVNSDVIFSIASFNSSDDLEITVESLSSICCLIKPRYCSQFVLLGFLYLTTFGAKPVKLKRIHLWSEKLGVSDTFHETIWSTRQSEARVMSSTSSLFLVTKVVTLSLFIMLSSVSAINCSNSVPLGLMSLQSQTVWCAFASQPRIIGTLFTLEKSIASISRSVYGQSAVSRM